MTRYLLEVWEGLHIALRAVRSHKMRAVLTTLGIIIGITSVTSMVTVINGIERSFDEQMSSLGMDVLYIERWPWMTGPTFKWWEYVNRPRISEDLAEVVLKRSRYAVAAAPVFETGREVKYKGRTTTRVQIEGSVPAYEQVNTVRITDGRFYNDIDHRTGRRVAVIGAAIADMLFPVENPLGKQIRIGGNAFVVIGVLERKGKGQGEASGQDEQVKIPLNTFKALFGITRRDASVRVKIADAALLEAARDEITGIVRTARGLDARDEDNFVINEQQKLREQMAPVKLAIYGIGIFLTTLSLLVGGIGVMNIMFVSVKERTQEIGVRKAVGARRRTILTQFLIEAVIVCLLGGAIAVAISYGLSELIGLALPAYLPFSTVLLAFGICLAIGVVFGLAPAWAAARAEPIEALRYE